MWRFAFSSTCFSAHTGRQHNDLDTLPVHMMRRSVIEKTFRADMCYRRAALSGVCKRNFALFYHLTQQIELTSSMKTKQSRKSFATSPKIYYFCTVWRLTKQTSAFDWQYNLYLFPQLKPHYDETSTLFSPAASVLSAPRSLLAMRLRRLFGRLW